MIEMIFLLVLGAVYLALASAQDIKKREVANWLSFSLIIFGIFYRISYSLWSEDLNFLIQGLMGTAIFVGLGFAMYYGRFFAGGDAKLIMALGAIIFVFGTFAENLISAITFLAFILIAGAVYGSVFSLVLAIKSRENFKREFFKLTKAKWKIIQISWFFAIVSLALAWFLKEEILFLLPLMIFVVPWVYIYAKAVDEGCMIFPTDVNRLVEGDWLYKDVKISSGKIIKQNWEGLSSEEIGQLKKSSVKSVLIRQGIPFVPPIFIAYLVWVYIVIFNPGFLYGLIV